MLSLFYLRNNFVPLFLIFLNNKGATESSVCQVQYEVGFILGGNTRVFLGSIW